MTYARRPMGDYKTYGYAGDPGFLSSLWKGIKKIAPTIIGGMIGGPVGAVIGGGGGGGQVATRPPVLTQQPGGGATYGGAVTFPGGMQIGAVTQRPGVGRLPPYTAAGPGVLPGGGQGTMVPSGYHWAKDGSGRLVRNRRMNVANPKALRRAMRRAQGFEKLARRSINFNKRVRPARKRST